MESMTDAEIMFALRRRMQSQTLCHLVDQKVSASQVLRFRRAGTWPHEIPVTTPPETLDILRDAEHPRRLPTSDGPLIVVQDPQERGVIDVAEHLLSIDRRHREAALEHLASSVHRSPPWISPHTQQVITEQSNRLLADEEQLWIDAGLTIQDTLRDDFRVNLAGLKQSAEVAFDQGYDEYFLRVLRPRFSSFEQDRPSTCDPRTDRDQICKRFEEWVATCSTPGEALDKYLHTYGFLPFADPLSAGSLVSMWQDRRGEINAWQTLWKWAEEMPTPLKNYHVCAALMTHIEWVPDDGIERLLSVVRDIIDATIIKETNSKAPLWRLRTSLQQHYQYHIESLAVGFNGEPIAIYACWIAEMVAGLFGMNAKRADEACKSIVEKELDLSARRWAVARTRTRPADLRSMTLFSKSLWADSLLAITVRNWHALRQRGAPKAFHDLLLERLLGVLCLGRLRADPNDDIVYAFESPVDFPSLDIDPSGDPEGLEASTAKILTARRQSEGADGVRELLSCLRTSEDSVARFCGITLRSQQFGRGIQGQIVKDFLADDAWRFHVFQELSLSALDPILIFITEWQLHQDDDWAIRVPHIFAFECERSETPERQELLFTTTLFSSLTVDIAGPALRLLNGGKVEKCFEWAKYWRNLFESISGHCEPWLAARIRGFLGTISPVA